MEDLKVCSFAKCRLGRGNLLVKLREDDITPIHLHFKGPYAVKIGDTVCALHYTPCPGRQVKSALKTGHVEPEAKLGNVGQQYKYNHQQRLARQQKNLQIQNEKLQIETKEEAVSSIIQPMEGNCRYMHYF